LFILRANIVLTSVEMSSVSTAQQYVVRVLTAAVSS